MHKLIKLLYSVVAVGLTWYVSGLFTSFGIFNWYTSFEKPTFTPPDSWFPIIWAVLYVLMAWAFYLALIKADKNTGRKINQLFMGQLILQIIWTYTFFTMGYIGVAFGIIMLLDLVVYKLILALKGLEPKASYLLYPYFWWLVYASFINFSFIYINGMVIEF